MIYVRDRLPDAEEAQMRRVTISMDDEVAATFDRVHHKRSGFPNIAR
jgi:hypothetical protein